MSRHRCLAVLERAYRGALEEQYGHILWICWSICQMNRQIGVLLRGHAALYARCNCPPQSLTISGIAVHLPNYEESIRGLLSQGGTVYVVNADLDRLQLSADQLCSGVRAVDGAELTRLFADYDAVWYL
jgi:sulfur relay (sulfurtransferase) DsrF/TusC family protein